MLGTVDKFCLLLILTLPLFGSLRALSSPIYSASGSLCVQLNTSYIKCQDGVSVPVTFSVAAPYPLYYGNFTLYSVDQRNVSNPMNISGGQCTVHAGSSSTCVMNLIPFSIFSGNATVNRSISLNLISSTYPQSRFSTTVVVTISHYTTAFERVIVATYAKVNASYLGMNTTYRFFCATYRICSTSVKKNLTKVANLTAISLMQINSSNFQEAFANISAANGTRTALNQSFSGYVTNANLILFIINQSKSVIANETSLYQQNSQKLGGCSFPNKTSYAFFINASIADLKNYSALNNLTSARLYLNSTKRFANNETLLINLCTARSIAAPLGFSLLGLQLGSLIVPTIVGVIVIAILAYLALRFLSRGTPEAEPGFGEQFDTGAGGAEGEGSERKGLVSSFFSDLKKAILPKGGKEKEQKQE